MSRGAASAIAGLLTVLIVATVVSQVQTDSLLLALSSVPVSTILLGGGAALVMAVPLSSESLFWVLRGLGQDVQRATTLRATVGSLAINGVLPAWGGEVSRAAWLYRTAGVPLSAASVSAVLVLVFKLVALLGVSSVSVWWVAGSPVWLRGGLGLVTAGLVALTLAAPWMARRLAAESLPRGLGPLVRGLSEGTSELRLRPLALGAVYAVAVVAGEWLVFGLLLESVGGPWVPAQVLAWFPLATIAGKLPITAMGLGTREAAVLVLFQGVDPAALLSATLLHSTLAHLFPTLVGTLTTWYFVGSLLAPPES